MIGGVVNKAKKVHHHHTTGCLLSADWRLSTRAAAAGPLGAGGQARAVQCGARLGRGAEQAVRPGHARQGAAHQGLGHRDEDSGEPIKEMSEQLSDIDLKEMDDYRERFNNFEDMICAKEA